MIFNGATAGLVYGVLAVGIVLIYRSSRVINFAYGELAAFAATLMARLVFTTGDGASSRRGWWSLVAGALLSAVIELTVVRRLFDAPRVILFVATLGVTQLMMLLELLCPAPHEPVRLPHRVHDAVHGRRGSSCAASTSSCSSSCRWSRSRSRGSWLARGYGRAIRASAANPDAAAARGRESATHVDVGVDDRRRVRGV